MSACLLCGASTPTTGPFPIQYHLAMVVGVASPHCAPHLSVIQALILQQISQLPVQEAALQMRLDQTLPFRSMVCLLPLAVEAAEPWAFACSSSFSA